MNEGVWRSLSALLDAEQLRVLLCEALGAVPAGAPDQWQRVASYVNQRCPRSEPRPGAAFERASQILNELGAVGPETWTQLLYGVVQSSFRTGSHFLNLGYAPPPHEAAPPLREEDEPDRLFIQLYLGVLGSVSLAGRSVLEVGCGRGGGCSYVSRYLRPAGVVGLDLSRANIDGRPNPRDTPGARFVRAGATALPFVAARFDVVVSVESSHGYRPFAAFASEVHRVLKAGGVCLLGDLRVSSEWPAVRDELRAAGLELAGERDLSDGVLRGIDLNEQRQRLLLEALNPNERARRAEIMLHRGSAAYERFKRGESRFLALTLRR